MYEIADYDERYRPYDKSGGELRRADWVKLPVKPRGDGLGELLEHRRGLEIFGIWCLLLEKTTAEKPENRGKLLNHREQPATIPEIAKGISLKNRVKLVQEALSVLVSIGWVKSEDNSAELPQTPAKSSVVKSKVLKSRVGISYDYNKECFTNITPEKKSEWEKAFPAVDIDLDLKSAVLWVKDNPTKRKSNWGRFLTSWFKRTQDHGGNKVATKHTKTKLFPLPGKVCEKCPPRERLPAVYKTTGGSYDHYYCAEHMPAKVKEQYAG